MKFYLSKKRHLPILRLSNPVEEHYLWDVRGFIKYLQRKRQRPIETISKYWSDLVRSSFKNRDWVQHPMHILEAGAHIGSDTELMHVTWPHARIFAFEPSPAVFDRLQARKLGPNVLCFPLALSTQNGEQKFYVDDQDPDAGTSSLLKATEWYKNGRASKEYEILVQTRTLDSWANEQQVDYVDLMWLDLEGMELPVLQHGTKLLSTVNLLYVEVNFQILRENYTMCQDLLTFLETNGFVPLWKDVSAQLGKDFCGNVLLGRKK